MTKALRMAALVLSASLFAGGCVQDVNMPAAGAAGWRGKNPTNESTVRFVVIGDRTGGHVPGQWEKAIADINRLQPDLVISVGDVIEGYKDDPQVLEGMWQEITGIISRLDAPYFYTVGNHDVESGNPAEPNKARDVYLRKHSVQGRSYYSFDYKDAHFIVLDSAWANKDELFATEQLSWLREDIARSQKTQHIFVFYHHPLWDNTNYWQSLSSILPKGKTTIFNGHTHSMNYRLADGIPTYVLPSTGARNNASDPAQQHVFAYVALNGKQPIISFIPVGAIRPDTFAQTIGQLRETMSGSGLAEIPASGGPFSLEYQNHATSPMTVSISVNAPGWTITPATANVEIPAGGTARQEFVAELQGPDAAAPTISEQFSFADGTSISRERQVPLYREGKLATLPTVTLDGRADEWADVPALKLESSALLFQGAPAWKGPADSSATVRVATSGDRLVLLIEAKDDQLVINDEANPWEQDGIEVCWDLRSERKPGMTAGTGQLAITPAATEGSPRKAIWIPAGKQAKTFPSSVECYTRRVEGGYIAEIAIPTSALGGEIPQDQPLRLSVTLADLDGGEDGAVLKRMSLTGTGDFWRSTAGYARMHRD